MKKLVLIFGLMFVFLAASLNAQDAVKKTLPATKKTLSTKSEAKPAKKAEEAINGKIISLNDFVMTGNTDLTADKAMELANNGQPLVFLSDDGTIFFPYSKDGKYELKKAAQFAGKKLAVVGKQELKDGINYIVVKKATPVE